MKRLTLTLLALLNCCLLFSQNVVITGSNSVVSGNFEIYKAEVFNEPYQFIDFNVFGGTVQAFNESEIQVRWNGQGTKLLTAQVHFLDGTVIEKTLNVDVNDEQFPRVRLIGYNRVEVGETMT